MLAELSKSFHSPEIAPALFEAGIMDSMWQQNILNDLELCYTREKDLPKIMDKAMKKL